VSLTSFKIVISRHYLYVLRLDSLLQSFVVLRLYRNDEEENKDKEVEDNETRAHCIKYSSK
jgi:hypothetical protein